VLNAQLVDQPWGKDPRGEGAAEDGAEFGVQTANAHVFELEIGSHDGVGCWSSIGAFEVDTRLGVFVEVDGTLWGQDSTSGGVRLLLLSTAGLHRRQIYQFHSLDRQSQGNGLEVHKQLLSRRKHLISKVLCQY